MQNHPQRYKIFVLAGVLLLEQQDSCDAFSSEVLHRVSDFFFFFTVSICNSVNIAPGENAAGAKGVGE